MDQLIKAGRLVRVAGKLTPAMRTIAGYIKIPVLGEADCGEATKFADGRIIDTLTLSPSVLNTRKTEKLFALIARGDSMNATIIHGKAIEDSDYVIVEKIEGYEPVDNEIIVSNIGGFANIKKFKREPGRIILLSQSLKQEIFSPIFIDEGDEYSIEGKVVDVIKTVQ